MRRLAAPRLVTPLAALLVAVAACGESTGPATNRTPGSVTATIDGAPWAANYQTDLAVADLSVGQQLIEIVGLEVTPAFAGRQVSLVIEGFTGVGTYALGAESAGGSFGYYITSPNLRAPGAVRDTADKVHVTTRAGAGTVTVTSYDATARTIAGTFSLTVARLADSTARVAITNGAFSGRVVTGP